MLAIETERLPVLWDADFLYRTAPERRGAERFALCEVNASCVSPFSACGASGRSEGCREPSGREAATFNRRRLTAIGDFLPT